jgi:NhaC family Na+:H+ antiporter
MGGFLGVSAIQYAPYAVLNWINPIVSVIYGFTGITMEKMSDEEYESVMEKRRMEKEMALKTLEA